MAVFTGEEGLFEITAITFTPSVIQFGETVSVSVTIKNISGKSVSSMYLTVEGRYARPNSVGVGYCGMGELYLHGSAPYNMASVSWAANASKTFTFSYAFTKGYYDADLSSYVMSKTMRISITTGTIFSTGGNYDNFSDITAGRLSVLSLRDNPKLSMRLDRCIGGQVNDEGEDLLVDLKLMADTSDTTFTSHGYSASISCTPAPAGGCGLLATITNMLSGVEDSTSAITGTFNNGTDYVITITVTNGYETASASQEVSRAFANVHMSGKSTGGVCFGGFSSAEEDDPKLECYFPAFFFQGIRGVTNYALNREDAIGTWFDGRTIYRRTFNLGTVSVATGSVTTNLCAVSGITEMISLSGRCYFANTWVGIPRIWSTTAGTLSLDFNNGNIRLRTIMNAATTLEKLVVSIDYLKDGDGVATTIEPSAYTASSTYSSGYAVGNAFDGNSSTSWASTNADTSPYITVTLPVACKDIIVSVYSRANTNGGAPSKVKCCLGTSTSAFDESTAVTVNTDGAATTSKLLGTLSMNNTDGYRYFRLYFTKGSKQSYTAIGYIVIRGITT